MNYRAGIVRMLQTESNKTVGTGFVASATLVVTCAHVAEKALGKDGDSVRLSFYGATYPEEAQQEAKVDRSCWSSQEQQDIAVLRLARPLPDGVEPLLLGSSPVYPGHKFESFGFPSVAGHDELPVEGDIGGRIQGKGGYGLLVLSSDNILKGMSGAPVWDTVSQRVVGMINGFPVWTDQERRDKRKIAGDSFGRGKGLNFGPTSETIRALCSELHISDRNPYMGLRTFSEENADLFFGREAYIDELVEKLRNGAQFLAIVGASGSGKSSLVYAGLLPRLRSGEKIPGSDNWGYIHFRPGSDPYAALAAEGLVGVQSGRLKGGIEEYLASNPDLEHLLLFADQFEELFALCDEATRDSFLDEWAGLVGKAPKLTLLLTMQAGSYYGEALKHAGLGKLLSRSELKVLPMNEEELRDAVSLPAQELGLRFEPGLVEDIVEEASKVSHPLPLLQESLSTLWELEKEGGTLPLLTHDTFREQVGGVGGAVGRRATEFYNSLSEREQATARHVFTRLVHIGEGGQDNTLQQNQMEDLVTRSHSFGEIQHVAWMLADERFLVLGDEANPRSQPVRIVHQVLLDEWDRLSQWIREREDFLRWLQRFDQRRVEWEARGFDSNLLLRGPLLVEAVGWQASNAGDLSDEQIRYMEDSSSAQEQAERRQRLFTTAAGIAAVVMLALALFAGNRAVEADRQAATADANSIALEAEVAVRSTAEGNARDAQTEAENSAEALSTEVAIRAAAESAAVDAQKAEQEAREDAEVERDNALRLARINLSRQLAQATANLLGTDYDLALLLALQANQIEDTLDSRQAILRALNHTPELVTRLQFEASTPALLDVDYSPVDDLVVFANCSEMTGDGTCLMSQLQTWDAAEAKFGARLLDYPGRLLNPIFSPSGEFLAMISSRTAEPANILLIDSKSGDVLQTLEQNASSIAFGSSDDILISATFDGRITIWDLITGEPLDKQMIGHSGIPIGLDVSHDGDLLASSDSLGNVIIWDLAERRLIGQPSVHGSLPVSSIKFSADTDKLLSSNEERVILWDLDSRSPVVSTDKSPSLIGPPCIYLSPGSDFALVCNTTGVAKVDLASDPPVLSELYDHGAAARDIAVNPRTSTIVSTSLGGDAIVWRLGATQRLGAIVDEGDRGELLQFAVHPDGNIVALVKSDSISLLDLDRPGLTRAVLPIDDRGYRYVEFSPDGELLAASHLNGVTVWEWLTGTQLQEFTIPAQTVEGSFQQPKIDFSSNGESLIAATFGGKVLSLDLVSGTVDEIFESDSLPIFSMLLHENGESVILGAVTSVDSAGTVSMLDLTGETVQAEALPIELTAVTDIETNSIDNTLAIAGIGGIILWDVSAQQSLGALSGESVAASIYSSVAFSPDGELLAGAYCSDMAQSGECISSTIGLWELSPFGFLGEIQFAHNLSITDLAFLPDSMILLSSSSGRLLAWDLSLDSWKTLACQIANRELGEAEVAQYVGSQIDVDPLCEDSAPFHPLSPLHYPADNSIIDQLSGVQLEEHSDVLDEGSVRGEQVIDLESVAWSFESAELPQGLELEFPAIVQCRESVDSPQAVSQFLSVFAVRNTVADQWVSLGQGQVSLGLVSSDEANQYETEFTLASGEVGWLMSERNASGLVMEGATTGETAISLDVSDVSWESAETVGDQSPISVIDAAHYTYGSDTYPQHMLVLEIENSRELPLAGISALGVIRNSQGETVDIVRSEGQYDITSGEVAWVTLKSISRTGRCVSAADPDGYTVHYWLTHWLVDSGQPITAYDVFRTD